MNQQAFTGWVLQHGGQRVQVNTVARVGSYFDRAQFEPLQRLQGRVKGGRLHRHHITGLRHRLQAQVQGFHGAMGDDHFVRFHGCAAGRITQADLAAQALVALGQVFHQTLWRQFAHSRCQTARQFVQRKQRRAGKGRTQRHHIGLAGGFQHRKHQRADLDRVDCDAGGRRARLGPASDWACGKT
jgi:hypothetical protein